LSCICRKGICPGILRVGFWFLSPVKDGILHGDTAKMTAAVIRNENLHPCKLQYLPEREYHELLG
jgi:hypothetical protein